MISIIVLISLVWPKARDRIPKNSWIALCVAFLAVDWVLQATIWNALGLSDTEIPNGVLILLIVLSGGISAALGMGIRAWLATKPLIHLLADDDAHSDDTQGDPFHTRSKTTEQSSMKEAGKTALGIFAVILGIVTSLLGGLVIVSLFLGVAIFGLFIAVCGR
jgi:hypothetical protein